ncbi:MAG: AraC family transcriptional regulator [Proteobacteria bacterium]|nr:AraC family transcriptional regulator [Pseudomonadota bacterium]
MKPKSHPLLRVARLFTVLALLAAPIAAMPSEADTTSARSVDQDVQALKKQLIELNRDLFKLEEELLYPASTQVAVFLSVDVGTFFALDSVTLKVDDKEVANYLYTEREVQALHRGGVQKLYLGNLKAGSHEVVAFFTGKGPHDRDYRRGTTLKVDKTVGAKYVELRISDREASLQPEFVVRQWE